MMHVTNRSRWNRTKGIAAFALWVAGLAAVGGENSTSRPHYDIAFICLSACAGLLFSIYRRH